MMSSIPRILSISTPNIYTDLIYHPFHQLPPHGTRSGPWVHPRQPNHRALQVSSFSRHLSIMKDEGGHDHMTCTSVDPRIRVSKRRRRAPLPAVLKKTPRGTENQRILNGSPRKSTDFQAKCPETPKKNGWLKPFFARWTTKHFPDIERKYYE